MGGGTKVKVKTNQAMEMKKSGHILVILEVESIGLNEIFDMWNKAKGSARILFWGAATIS